MTAAGWLAALLAALTVTWLLSRRAR
jgi:hypothetical protein